MRQPLVHFTLLVYFLSLFFFFFFNDTATTEIYTLSLHDALPISSRIGRPWPAVTDSCIPMTNGTMGDRKSTRLNSSHLVISYAVFCLKKKKNTALLLLSSISTHVYPPVPHSHMSLDLSASLLQYS